MTTDNDNKLSPSEIQSVLSGRSTFEEIERRNQAEREKGARQIEDFHRHQAQKAERLLMLEQHGALDLSAVSCQIEELKEANEVLCRRVALLESRLPLILDGGKLPSDMSDLECQIFHTPLESIPAAQRRVKTEWSLRLTAWIGGRRAKPDINVPLYSGEKFWLQVMERNERHSTAENVANQIRTADHVLAGMLKAITKKKGRPYISSQFCVMAEHLIDTPSVLVVVDGREIALDCFRPGKGEKANRARWYAKVQL